MNLTENEIVLTSVGTIFAYIASKNYFIPWIIKIWDWIIKKKKDFDDKNVDASEEILDYKKSTVEVQEKQFQVLLNQITQLEEELMKYSDELKTLRTTILRLNSRLYDKSLLIAELQKKSCCIESCPHRQLCENKLDEIDELNEVK